MPEFAYTDLLPIGPDRTDYRLLTTDGVDTVDLDGRRYLSVRPDALRRLAADAFTDMAQLLRPAHLAQLRSILDDPAASPNDRYVATELIQNACVSAGGVLPMCQDTGTAIVMASRGMRVLTDGRDHEHLAHGIHDAYTTRNLRYSQLAPTTMFDEQNTGTNLPAQTEISAGPGATYDFLFMAKGCGSANKSVLYQMTPALLNPVDLMRFLQDKVRSIGTSACPPYHLAIVIGGTTGEFALKTAKLASAKYLDTLPTSGSPTGHGFRDIEMESAVLDMTRQLGIGAQFGGTYFCHDVRVIRLPRHAGSLPIAIAVSCAAYRQALGRVTQDGVFLEDLEHDPAAYLPEPAETDLHTAVHIDLTRPMVDIRAHLAAVPVGTRLSMSGPLVVARDLAHAKIKERLDAGAPLPDYLRDHPVYYAGRPRPHPDTQPDPSDPRRPAAWTPTSSNSRPPEAP